MASSQFVREAGVSLHFTVWEVSITEFTSTLFVNSHPFYIHVYTRVITPFMTKASELSIQWYQLRWESLWKIETFPGLITGSVSGRPSAPQGQGRRPTPGATPIGNKRPSGNKLVSSSCSSCRTGGRLHKPQCKGMQQKLCRLHGGFRTFETRTGRLRCNKISGQPAQSNSDKSRRGRRNHSWPGWRGYRENFSEAVANCSLSRLASPRQGVTNETLNTQRWVWNISLFTCLCDVMDFHETDRSLLVVKIWLTKRKGKNRRVLHVSYFFSGRCRRHLPPPAVSASSPPQSQLRATW